MATYPLTGSTLNSKISTGLSTQIIVKVDNITVGAIQNITINQTRDLERVKEVGLDGVLEIVPKAPTQYDATLTRIVFDRLRLPEAFARAYINIKSQLVSFDILIIDRSNGDGDLSVTHTLKNCWFNRYTPKYQADSFIIQEDSTIWIEDISSTLGSSQASAVQGGDRGIIPITDIFGREKETDAGAGGTGSTGGGFRGTMDVSGLMRAADQ